MQEPETPQDPKLTTLGKLVVLLFILGSLAAALVSWRGGLDDVPGRAGWEGVTSTWTWSWRWTG